MKNVLKTAYIIGNGVSRSSFDLMNLKGKGKVFGCNALYLDYAEQDYVLPDYLVAIDNPIIAEIEKSDFPKERFLNPPEDEKWEPVELHWKRSVAPGWSPARPRSNAGMNAIQEAIKKGYTTIFIFGFDFLAVSEASTNALLVARSARTLLGYPRHKVIQVENDTRHAR